jgi:hypothetical protein
MLYFGDEKKHILQRIAGGGCPQFLHLRFFIFLLLSNDSIVLAAMINCVGSNVADCIGVASIGSLH